MTPKRVWIEAETPKFIFVSDIHLGSGEDPKFVLFLDFLKSLKDSKNPTHLFLLGDIFDLWIAGHRYFVEAYRPIVEEIKRLVDSGVQVHYFEGNHDLYLSSYWQGELGVIVHSGPVNFHWNQLVFRVEHGDQMDPHDHGYRFLRWFLRTPLMTWLAPRLPERWVVKIGEWASAKSRTYTTVQKGASQEKSQRIFRDHVKRAMDQEPFHYLVAGHVHHRDEFLILPKVKAVNLGTWLDRPCFWEWSVEGEALRDLPTP